MCLYSLLTDNSVHTKMTIFVQVAFYGAMHKMLKGAYNSGEYMSCECHMIFFC